MNSILKFYVENPKNITPMYIPASWLDSIRAKFYNMHSADDSKKFTDFVETCAAEFKGKRRFNHFLQFHYQYLEFPSDEEKLAFLMKWG